MRILSLITMLVMLTIMASAQTSGGEVVRKPKIDNNGVNRGLSSSRTKEVKIKRYIDGVSLGMSTKQEVIKLLTSREREYDISEPNDNYAVIISNGKIHYYGVTWDAIAYKLYNNTVFQISYLKNGNKSKESSNVVEYVKLRDYFVSVYGKFHKSLSEGEHFSDKITYLFLVGGKPKVQQDLSLHFADVKIYDLLTR